MAFVNYNNKEITVKIVYYGPALSGKTTCLRYIYESGEYRKKGKLITLDTDGDRTLFFDFLPIEIGKLGDYSIKMQLYTVPGQVAYNTTRKLVLQGSDGIVFVADSQVVMRDQNLDSFNNLKENLKANNIAFEETPIILQYNKRDLKEIMPIELLNRYLNPENKAFFPTIGTTGENVLEGLHTIMKMVIIHLKNKLSIFQKDKTVMFSRDEITDSVAKKNAAPKIEPEPVIIPQPKKPEPIPPMRPHVAPQEKEDIFELSSPMMDEPMKTRDYKRLPDEDIFNLGDESRMGNDENVFEIPDVVMADEMDNPDEKAEKDDKDTNAVDLSELRRQEPETQQRSKSSTIEEIDVPPVDHDYELKPEDIVMESQEPTYSIPASSDIKSTTSYSIRTGVDVPIHIDIPEDKDEISINLNLRITIKRKS